MRLKVALLLLILISLYIYFSYARFYNFFLKKNLQSPQGVSSFVLDNPSSFGPLKYVALGDSLSAGVGSTNSQETFVYQFALHILKKSGKVNVVNLAQPGATTEDLIQRELPKALSENPDYVTLLIGVNDLHNRSTLSDFRLHYQYILNELKNKTKAQIIVLNLPYLGSDKLLYPPLTFLLDFRTRQFNDVISSFAPGDRIKLVDLYGGTRQNFAQNPGLYSPDLFHPSGEGYILWSKLLNAD